MNCIQQEDSFITKFKKYIEERIRILEEMRDDENSSLQTRASSDIVLDELYGIQIEFSDVEWNPASCFLRERNLSQKQANQIQKILESDK